MNTDTVVPRPLFSGVDIRGLKLHHQQMAKDSVDHLSSNMLKEDEAKLASKIVASLTLELPVIDESRIYTQRSTNQTIVHIPFKGDFSLFDVRPFPHGSDPPLGEIDPKKCEILLTYRKSSSTLPLDVEYAGTLREIKRHLDWMRPNITDTTWLREYVLQQIAMRKQVL